MRRSLCRALLVLCVMGSGAAYISTAHAQVRQEKSKSVAKQVKPAKRAVASAPKSASRAKASAAAGAAGAAGAVAAGAAAKPVVANTAEARLLDVIDLVKRQELDAALRAAAQLTADVPNFRAAQLVYADLLRFKTGRMTGWANAPTSEVTQLLVKHVSADPKATPAAPLELQEQAHGLQKELQRRVHGAGAVLAAGSVPREFQQLGASVRHAVAIDASKSRLYLFRNEKGKLRLIGDFYVSIGKFGMGKSLEGDQRTPQGVYFIGRQIPGARLPEFYGKGALTLNYPNDWDKAVDRSGDGIWLHGSPPDQFARLPEASDGCIVLANPDLILLMKTLDRQTPVLMRDKLEWTGPSDRSQARTADAFVRVLDNWQQAWKSADPGLLAKMYGQEPAAQQVPRARLTEFFRFSDIGVQDLSVYAWKDPQGEIRIVDMQIGSRKAGKSLPLRQYWRRLGDRWEVLSEEIRS
ncbi:murein L,D-transpeptidase family protein [Pantoea sp. 18069]|uniref:L,D-transpeptidase family protein n=1 Tax=Pantoea sp. 18069 TaxID=2681415 RepID=UPI00135A83ED|nr:L,D-transpeptidase family protein [Pantoea sp. 18069]